MDAGYACNYSRSVAPLELTFTRVFRVRTPSPTSPLTSKLRIPIALPVPGRLGDYELRPNDYATLERFRKRTLMTIGSPSTQRVYNSWAFDLATKRPFLYHVFLAFSIIHDMYIGSETSIPSSLSSSLAFHWYHATAILKQMLARSNDYRSSCDRDALMTSASLLGAAAFAYVGTTDPARVWPLREPDPADLDWLRMSDGKKVVFELSDPGRPESVFYPLVQDMSVYDLPDGQAPIPPGVLPPALESLCNLTQASAPGTNPYRIAASIVALLLPLTPTDDNIFLFMTFAVHPDVRFKKLLHRKDPPAMLLLAWWYAKVAAHPVWWLRNRPIVEGRAICLYLEKHHNCDARILELLESPRRAFNQAAPEQAQEPRTQPSLC